MIKLFLSMNSKPKRIGMKNQLKRFRLPLLIFLLFWVAGVLTLYFLETEKSFWYLILVSIGVRDGTSLSDFVGFYQLLWPIMFELLILGFLFSILLEFYSYNPEAHSLKLAKSKKNHSVVLGYNHLGERIVDHLRNNKKPYVVAEILEERVDDLIFAGEPVIIGDHTDETVLRSAGVHKCKEVFCVTTKLRSALIAASKIRKLNPECNLYMRVFNEHFRQNLAAEPYNAFTFSISNWAMDSVKKWSESLDGKALILGQDTLVQRILTYFGGFLKKEIVAIHPDIEAELYFEYPNVLVLRENAKYLESLEELSDIEEIDQIYICWNKEELFSDAIILTMELKKKYPDKEIFVRIFDEELAEIAKNIGASTFSTSAYAFQMLQNEVRQNSNIFPIIK